MPAEADVVEEEFEVGAVLRLSKSNSTPSGVFNETTFLLLGTKAEVLAFKVLVGTAEGVEGDGANPPMEADG
jgi:hypothetical protein